MAGGDLSAGSQYGTIAGFIFVFNLVVGAGCLTLPNAFNHTGAVLGTIGLLILGQQFSSSLLFVLIPLLCEGFLSYMSLTWVIEAMACSNAMLVLQESKDHRPSAFLR